jgi:phosphatidylserine/phosphatidylglycerophosphate/cardiolipin synthase-like enzyme
MTPPRTITLFDFLTEEEIVAAVGLNNRILVRDQIIIPNLKRIDAKLGQSNDADYMSYLVEHVMRSTNHWT